MESLKNINLKRQIAQQLMQKAQASPTTIKPGEAPANAWAPVVQALMGGLQDRRLAGQEKEATDRYQQTIRSAFSPNQTLPAGFTEEQASSVAPIQTPKTLQESSTELLGNPDTADLGNKLLLSDLQNRSGLEKLDQQQSTQHKNRLAEIDAEMKGRKELAGMAASSKLAAQNAKKGGSLSPTAQKELFEADDMVNASNNAVALLNKALEFNDKAYSGLTAKARMIGSRALPGTYEGADASTELDNIMTGQALETLKATFGGMPTEGERRVLMDMQASLDKTPEQRKAIIDRAIQLAKRRGESHASKAKALREGTYFSEQPEYASPELDPADFSGLSDDDFLKRRPGAVR